MNIKEISNSITTKIITIGILILILLIPSNMAYDLIKERKYTKDEVVNEISEKWGNAQKIYGPYLLVPYEVSYYDNKTKVTAKQLEYFYILPKKLDINASVKPQIRYRSIYEAVLYNADINISGEFDYLYVNNLDIDKKNILWDKAVFSLEIADLRGIEQSIDLSFSNKSYALNSGLKKYLASKMGINSKVDVNLQNNEKFSLNMKLRGSKYIKFAPVGEFSKASVVSDWKSPSFIGSFLPSKRQIGKDGFDATWSVAGLSRSYPQAFLKDYDMSNAIQNSSFGVNFIITADIYQKTTRVSKYALLFIVFSFGAFFFCEVLTKHKIHPIQYLLVGFGVVLFYILLLALGEHLGFNVAYILASILITGLITLYSHGVLKNKYFTTAIFCTLSILYGYLFVVLQQESYSLLMGAIGLFVVLSVIMYATRNIDWYKVRN